MIPSQASGFRKIFLPETFSAAAEGAALEPESGSLGHW